jgi:hypothetical protein
MLASLTFVTPFGGLLALAVVLPLAAFAISAAQTARGRALLRLDSPEQDRHVTLAALVAVPLLLGLAAAEPALRSHVGRRVRTDAQAVFVFDTSRSMAAAAGSGAPTRFKQAQAAAIRLRNDAIPEVPSGISTVTTQLLPHLFPTPDEAVFNSTVRNAIGIEMPPPPVLQLGVPGTAFSALAPLRNEGYFEPRTKKRLVILLTDGESGPYDPAALADTLVHPGRGQPGPGEQTGKAQPPVSLFIVRVGSTADRIYYGDGSIEAPYRPDPQAPVIVSTLAALTKGHAFDVAKLSAATNALHTALGSGKTVTRGVSTKTIALAPYVVLVTFAALAIIIRKRNLASF